MSLEFNGYFYKKCTGCSACAKICPVNALDMKMDSEGFLYPVINAEKCVECGKCVNVCQIEKERKENSPKKILIAYDKDEEVRNKGSSGGVMVRLSETFLKNKGIVYGAVFDDQNKKIKHTCTKYDTLEKISRSKYVQSDTENSYIEVRQDLEEGKAVLFCGTPCQVNGLNLFLNKKYENLYTVDFFCHGVPSPKVFKDMLKLYEDKYNSKILDVTFREKTEGWRNQHMKFYFDNETVCSVRSIEEAYYYFFINDYTLRKSCYDCDCFNSHTSDLTLADSWGIKGDDDRGVSLILANTEKGKRLIDEIKDDLEVLKTSNTFDYSIYRHQYSEKNREIFFRLYNKKGYRYLSERYFVRKKLRNKCIRKTKRIILRAMGKKLI